MESLQLSNIELYYSAPVNTHSGLTTIYGEESNHIVNVMRHRIGDEIYTTNGAGTIMKGEISNILKKSVEVKTLKEYRYREKFPNITFCIPMLRNSDRLEFALEKCTELGVTNFIIYKAKRSVQRKINIKRLEKIILSAMKQSLLSWLPQIHFADMITNFLNKNKQNIIFIQNAENYFKPTEIDLKANYQFIFGPEGDFSDDELTVLASANRFKLSENRLRTETSIIKTASLLQ